MQIKPVPFDHRHAVLLNDLVQLEYQERYQDEGDLTPLDASMFVPPAGLFLLAYDVDAQPIATGGWRAHERNSEGYADGDAEIKRMFVVKEARGRGLARRILALLEEDARAAGRTRMVLETGLQQPEAIALYTSSGYQLTTKFGYYRYHAQSRCFAKPLRDTTSRLPA